MSGDNASAFKARNRLRLAWENALELMREGRVSEPYGTPFRVVVTHSLYQLRRYDVPAAANATDANAADANAADANAADANATPPARSGSGAPAILLVPPLMVTAEVYDISIDTSAVRALRAQGIDVWVLDFGAPERSPGGLQRTLSDHVRAVSLATDDIMRATASTVHLAGYSQGGMFCYQAAAWRKCRGVASVIALGSPVDWARALPNVTPAVADKILSGVGEALQWPLEHISNMPGVVLANGFKLIAAKKELGQLVDFVANLHDREALAKREARRLFLAGDGFVAWPGPSLRAFVADLVVANRMRVGGLIIDGDVVSLAALTCPIFYVVGTSDELARPETVRAIRDVVSPSNHEIYEAAVPAGHFGIVVGRIAQAQTWRYTGAWMGWIASGRVGALPPQITAVHNAPATRHTRSNTTRAALARKAIGAIATKAAVAGAELGAYLEHVRWQAPRLSALATLRDTTQTSIARFLAQGAAKHPEQTLLLWGARAISFGQAEARANEVAAAFAALGLGAGTYVGVWMDSRPSLLMLVVALNRIGAIAVIVPPQLSPAQAAEAAALVQFSALVVDDAHAASSPAMFPAMPLVVTSGALLATDAPPPEVPMNGGLARDTALILLRADTRSGQEGADAPLRATYITNRRWVFSALGAAAACLLTGRDTVYCALPLHHPSSMLVAASAALVGGARLALARGQASPSQLAADARTFGATVVFYAGDMCRALVDAPPDADQQALPIRLFAGSGMPADTWHRMRARFDAAIVEFYGASEANVILANTTGEKIGSVGRPLPGSAEIAIVDYDQTARDIARGSDGHGILAKAGETGLLLAKLEGDWHQLAERVPERILRDVLAFGDHWYNTRELACCDQAGDVFLRGREPADGA